MKLSDKAGTRTLLRKIDAEWVLLQIEEMMEVYDIRVVQQLDCFFLISLPINSTVKSSLSVCILLQDDQLRSNPQMTVQSIDDPNGASSQGRQGEMNNKHNKNLG